MSSINKKEVQKSFFLFAVLINQSNVIIVFHNYQLFRLLVDKINVFTLKCIYSTVFQVRCDADVDISDEPNQVKSSQSASGHVFYSSHTSYYHIFI